MDEEIAALRRAYDSSPDDPHLRAKLTRALIRAGDDEHAFSLMHQAGDVAPDLAQAVASAQRSVLRELVDLSGARPIVVATHAGPGRPTHACTCCHCCCSCCPSRVPGWNWSLLDQFVREETTAPVVAIDLHEHREGVSERLLDLVAKLGTLQYLSMPGAEITAAACQHLARLTQLRGLRMWSLAVDRAPALLRIVEGLHEVRTLDLVGRGFNDDVLDRISRLRPLTELHLAIEDSAVTSAGVAALGALSNLRALFLPRCDAATETALEGLGRLTLLNELDLRESRWVTDTGLEQLRGLSQLVSLDLARCTALTGGGLEPLVESRPPLTKVDLFGCKRLRDEALFFLADVPTLSDLNVGGCELLTDAGLADLGGLESLRRLKLADCGKLTDASLDALADLPALEDLDLSGISGITDAGLAHLAGLPLRRVALQHSTQITDEGAQNLMRIESLEELLAYGCSFTDAALGHLARLPRLRRIVLASPRITDDGLAQLGSAASLENLALTSAAITDDGLRSLEAVATLRSVTLMDVEHVTQGAVERLRAALPNATVTLHASR